MSSEKIIQPLSHPDDFKPKPITLEDGTQVERNQTYQPITPSTNVYPEHITDTTPSLSGTYQARPRDDTTSKPPRLIGLYVIAAIELMIIILNLTQDKNTPFLFTLFDIIELCAVFGLLFRKNIARVFMLFTTIVSMVIFIPLSILALPFVIDGRSVAAIVTTVAFSIGVIVYLSQTDVKNAFS